MYDVITVIRICDKKLILLQVMVFVHARNATMKTAIALRELAMQNNHTGFFEANESKHKNARKVFERAKAKQLWDIMPYGFGIHHAGLLRCDR